MNKNNSKSENPLNINQSTYELIPKIKELSTTMSQKEVQEKLKINKKTLKKIKYAGKINIKTDFGQSTEFEIIIPILSNNIINKIKF